MSVNRTSKLKNSARLPAIRLPPGLLDSVQLHAEEQGETLSDFVRRALREIMHQEKLHRRLQADRAALRDGVWADLEARHPKQEETRA